MIKKICRYSLLSLILFIGLDAIVFADNPSQGQPQVTKELLADLDRIFPKLIKTFDVPGAAIAIIQNGKVVYVKGFGVRNIKTGAPFTTETVHRIGSVSKSMTAMYVATQVDKDLFNWDTLVKTSSQLTQKMTVHQIMGMTTGLGENPIELYFDLYTPEYFFKTLNHLPILTPPGPFYYNNTIYTLSGYLGALKNSINTSDLLMNYTEEMKTQLFHLMGMKNTAITDNPATISDNYDTSYGYNLLEGVIPRDPQPFQPIGMLAPAGSVCTTINDMARYVITQLNGGISPEGKLIVSRKNLAATWHPQVKAKKELSWAIKAQPNDPYYGMGWFTDTVEGIPVLYHAGSVDSFKTDISLFPDAKIGIVIFTNSETGSYLIWTIRSYLFEKLYHHPATAINLATDAYKQQKEKYKKMADSVSLLPINQSTVAAYLGSYEKGWQVIYSNGHLWLTRASGYQLVLLPTKNGTYLIGSAGSATGFGMEVNFVKNKQGKIQMNIISNQKIIDSLSAKR